jgi:hypothetical protein
MSGSVNPGLPDNMPKDVMKLDLTRTRPSWQQEQGLSYCGSPRSTLFKSNRTSVPQQPGKDGHSSQRLAMSARVQYSNDKSLSPHFSVHGSQTHRVPSSPTASMSFGPRARVLSASAQRGDGGNAKRAPASHIDIRPQSARVPGYTGHQPGIVSETLVGRYENYDTNVSLEHQIGTHRHNSIMRARASLMHGSCNQKYVRLQFADRTPTPIETHSYTY